MPFWEDLVLGKLKSPNWYLFFSVLLTCLLDVVLILRRETLPLSLMGVKGLICFCFFLLFFITFFHLNVTLCKMSWVFCNHSNSSKVNEDLDVVIEDFYRGFFIFFCTSYHLLLQTLLVLESQRSQAVKVIKIIILEIMFQYLCDITHHQVWDKVVEC